jgi:CTP synthase
MKAIQYARENKKPFFGICLGLQLAIIEFARNVVGIKDATSMEFSEVGSMVVHYMNGQSKEVAKGGSMRLGAYDCELSAGTLAHKIYGSKMISERHRHRLEVNNSFLSKMTEQGLVVSGLNPKLNLVEVIEMKDHPFFIACQYHPEFKSRPFKPHPLFASFVKASGKL